MKKITKRFKSFHIPAWSILFPVLFFIYCCGHQPDSLSILTSLPMSKTDPSAYIDVETIYESDKELAFMVIWGQVATSGPHTLKWEIYNNKGDRIYQTSRENVTIRPNLFGGERVVLDRSMKDSLMPGLCTVRLYIDDKLAKSKNVQYVNKNIINKNVQRVVILPFKDVSSSTNMSPDGINLYLNTIANAIYFEVKRIVPDTIPHYVVVQKIGKSLKPKGFNNKECISLIADMFGKNIFITGDIEFAEFTTETSRLTVYVYNAKTGEIMKYNDIAPSEYYYSEAMHNLLVGIMREKGLLDYLKTCK